MKRIVKKIEKQILAVLLCTVMLLNSGITAFASETLEKPVEGSYEIPMVDEQTRKNIETAEPEQEQEQKETETKEVLRTLCEVCESDPCTCTGSEEMFVDSVTYEDDEVKIVVTALEKEVIPAGVTLEAFKLEKQEVAAEVSETERETAEYWNVRYDAIAEMLEREIQKTENQKMTGFFAYDITLKDEGGNRLEPRAKIQVSVDYKKAVAPEGTDLERATDLTMVQVQEDAEGNVINAVDMDQEGSLIELETSDTKEVTKVEFETESLSIFAFLWLEKNGGEAQELSLENRESSVPKLPDVVYTDQIQISLFDYDTKVNHKHPDGFYFTTCYGNKDMEEPEQNATYLSAKYTMSEDQHARQDLVCYNLYSGIPFLNKNYDGSKNEQVEGTEKAVSLGYLFTENNDVTSYTGLQGLFRIDHDGYYYYDSRNNHAQLDETNKKIDVYDGTITHNENAGKESQGQFLPFDKIEGTTYTNEQGAHVLPGTANMWFGMKIDTMFYQPENGKINDKDMTFEFSGDDDVWVFIDGVKVLDIGGIHDRLDGSINFATGDVEVQLKTASEEEKLNTTILECFKKAYKEMNSTEADDEYLKNIFAADSSGKLTSRFLDNSSHTLNFFYIERGAGLSNCMMKFNLPLAEEKELTVEKQIEGDTEGAAGDVDFNFQLSKKAVGEAEFSEAAGAAYTLIKANGNENKTTDSNGKFTLKSGEKAVFKDYSGVQYQVTEVGLDEASYEKVTICVDGETQGSSQMITGSNQSVSSDSLTIGTNSSVCFVNTCTKLQKLVIKKMLTGHEDSWNVDSGATYKFRVTVAETLYAGEYKVGSSKEDALSSPSKNAENGEILLKKNEVAVLMGTVTRGTEKGFPVGTLFKVEEINLRREAYQEPIFEVTEGTAESVKIDRDSAGTDDSLQTFYTGAASGKFLKDKDAEVIVTNRMWHSIQIQKKWETSVINPPTAYVGLYQKDKETGREVPVSDNSYIILNSENNFQNAFVKLPEAVGYTVKELREVKEGEDAEFWIANKGYLGVDNGEIFQIGQNSYRVTYGQLEQLENIPAQEIMITNTQLGSLTILKVSSENKKVKLAGAEFQVEKLKEGSSEEYELVGTGTTDKWGKLIFEKLEAGTYRVTEIKAPKGYSIKTKTVKVVIGKEGLYEVGCEIQNSPVKVPSKDIPKQENDKTSPAVFVATNTQTGDSAQTAMLGAMAMMSITAFMVITVIYVKKSREKSKN